MILVTGCTGYIGNRLCRRLLKSGLKVKGLVQTSELKKGKPLVDLGLVPVYGDLMNLSNLEQILEDVHLIYHLAGVHSTYSNTYNLYVKGTANLIQSIPNNKKISVVVSSNSSVYANSIDMHNKNINLKPNNPLGKITLEMEKTVIKYCKQYTILRIGEVYGDNEANPFSYINKGISLIGNGANYTSKIYIDDLINVLEKCVEKSPQGIFNICDNEPVQQLEFYQYAEKLCKTKFVNLRENVELNERIMLSIHGLRTLNITMDNGDVNERFNYNLSYPTYRDGLNRLLEKIF